MHLSFRYILYVQNRCTCPGFIYILLILMKLGKKTLTGQFHVMIKVKLMHIPWVKILLVYYVPMQSSFITSQKLKIFNILQQKRGRIFPINLAKHLQVYESTLLNKNHFSDTFWACLDTFLVFFHSFSNKLAHWN